MAAMSSGIVWVISAGGTVYAFAEEDLADAQHIVCVGANLDVQRFTVTRAQWREARSKLWADRSNPVTVIDWSNVAEPGDRVRLVSTADLDTRLQPGAVGTASLVDDRGTVHVRWDEGSTLGLIPGVDRWEVIGDGQR
jgi:hypothetical protein